METTCPVAVIAALFLLSMTETAAVEPGSCDLAQIGRSRELHEVLSHRAVEVIERAARSSWQTDDRLADLVVSSAEFGLGAGDLGRTLERGPTGAHEMAMVLNADTYRFEGWDYMDLPADACAVREVEVEFVNTLGAGSARIKFTFQNGRVVRASGWQRSIETGQVTPPDSPD